MLARPHGPLTADATEPAWNGYQLTVASPCGIVFERWGTPDDSDADLLRLTTLNRGEVGGDAQQLGAQLLGISPSSWANRGRPNRSQLDANTTRMGT